MAFHKRFFILRITRNNPGNWELSFVVPVVVLIKRADSADMTVGHCFDDNIDNLKQLAVVLALQAEVSILKATQNNTDNWKLSFVVSVVVLIKRADSDFMTAWHCFDDNIDNLKQLAVVFALQAEVSVLTATRNNPGQLKVVFCCLCCRLL